MQVVSEASRLLLGVVVAGGAGETRRFAVTHATSLHLEGRGWLRNLHSSHYIIYSSLLVISIVNFATWIKQMHLQ